VLILAGWSAGSSGRLTDPSLDLVVANDNRSPGGRLSGDTLHIDLDVRMARWRPEADSGPEVTVPVFVERGRAPQIPGPLIRVPSGTAIAASVRNALSDSTISVHGLLTRPAAADDTLLLRPGEEATVRFAAGDPGTYFYWAILGKHNLDIDEERESVSGAFIVDSAGSVPPDRILMINIWGRVLDSVTYQTSRSGAWWLPRTSGSSRP
jgi:FtsP/CotA-like multicopper oxidase with cupredoxin domain